MNEWNHNYFYISRHKINTFEFQRDRLTEKYQTELYESLIIVTHEISLRQPLYCSRGIFLKENSFYNFINLFSQVFFFKCYDFSTNYLCVASALLSNYCHGLAKQHMRIVLCRLWDPTWVVQLEDASVFSPLSLALPLSCSILKIKESAQNDEAPVTTKKLAVFHNTTLS